MLLLLDLRYKDKKNFRCYQMVHGIKSSPLTSLRSGYQFPHVAKLFLSPLFFEDKNKPQKQAKGAKRPTKKLLKTPRFLPK
jgi:hypothetical protein